MPEPVIVQRTPMVQKMPPGNYWWCACGRSTTQPFCDGTHQGTGFAPVKVEITEEKSIAWCACKHTGTPPFCDGSHCRLPVR